MGFSWFSEQCIRGGAVLYQGSILALDTVFLAGKLVPSIPSYVTEGALFGLSACSLINYPYQLTLLGKTVTDLRHGRATRDVPVMLATALKCAYVATGLVLSGTNLIAATCGLFGADAVQTTLYELMIPLGEASIAAGIVLTLSYLYFFRRVLSKPEQIESVLPFLKPESLTDEASQLASEIRHCMDKDTLRDLISRFSTEDGARFAAIVVKNIKTQRNIAWAGGILLHLTGYALMAVEKYYTPNSLQAAVINEFMAIAYTFDYGLRLGCEVMQRDDITGEENEDCLAAWASYNEHVLGTTGI